MAKINLPTLVAPTQQALCTCEVSRATEGDAATAHPAIDGANQAWLQGQVDLYVDVDAVASYMDVRKYLPVRAISMPEAAVTPGQPFHDIFAQAQQVCLELLVERFQDLFLHKDG